MPSASLTLRANLAAECRKRNRNPERIDELRLLIKEAVLAETIKRALDQDPQLTSEQRVRLAAPLIAGVSR